MIKQDLTEDMAIKMMMVIMIKILKTVAFHREEVTQPIEECLQIAVVTMAMMIDLDIIINRTRLDL